MKANSMIMAIIGITVAIVVFSSVLVPIVGDYSNESKVVYNNPTTQVSKVVDGEHTITIDGTTLAVEIDDVDVTPTGNTALVMSSGYNLLYQKSDSQIQLYNYTTLNTGFLVLNGDVEMTLSETSASIEYGAVDSRTTLELETEWAYIYDTNGEYGLYRSYNQNKTLYVNSIDDIRGSNILLTTHDWFSYVGEDVELLSGDSIKADYTLTPVSGMKDLYTISVGGTGTGYTFDVDNEGTPYTVHPWIIVAPIKVTAVSDVNAPVIPLVEIIPILVILGILLSTIIFFISRKNN